MNEINLSKSSFDRFNKNLIIKQYKKNPIKVYEQMINKEDIEQRGPSESY